jgi:hypothetical protein
MSYLDDVRRFLCWQDNAMALWKRLGGLIDSIILLHAQKDLLPWLEGAYVTLTSAGMIQRIPTFDIRKLHALGGRYPSMQALNTFTEQMWIVHDLAAGFQDGAAVPKEACGKLSVWVGACKKMVAYAPALEAKLVPIEVKMTDMAETFVKTRIHHALSATSKLLTVAADSQLETITLPEGEVNEALTKCDEASMLTTGIQSPEERVDAANAVTVAKSMLGFAFFSAAKQRGKALKEFVSIANATEMQLETKLDGSKLDTLWQKEFFFGVHGTVFGPPPSEETGEATSMSAEKFHGLAVPWQFRLGIPLASVLLCHLPPHLHLAALLPCPALGTDPSDRLGSDQ